MKLKDYFSKLKEQGKIKNEDYDKFLDTVPEGELPDALFPVLEENFLTKERAAAHKDVQGSIWAKALDPIDGHIKEMLRILPAELVLDIEKQDTTYKKIAAIKAGLPGVLEKASKTTLDEDAKKKLQEKEGVIQDLMAKFEKANQEYQQKEKDITSQWENKFRGYRLDSELEKKVNSFTFADAYKDSRPALTKALLGEIKQKHKLDLIDKDGELSISVIGENGAPLFNGNTAVTIDSLLEEPFKPFLKVNNAGTDPAAQPNAGTPRVTQTYPVNGTQTARRGANTEVQQ